MFLLAKEVCFKTGLWNEHLQINQDVEFFCRVLINAKEIVFSMHSYVLYRSNSNNKTSNLNSKLKASHAIVSWKLIEDNLQIIEGGFSKYINKGKFYIYSKISLHFKSLINENAFYF